VTLLSGSTKSYRNKIHLEKGVTSFERKSLLSQGAAKTALRCRNSCIASERHHVNSRGKRDRTAAESTVCTENSLAGYLHSVDSHRALYAVSSWLWLVAIGPSTAIDTFTQHPGTIWFQLPTKLVGAALSNAVDILLITSLFALLLSFHNSLPRYRCPMGVSGFCQT
jgi:hypothetical protein